MLDGASLDHRRRSIIGRVQRVANFATSNKASIFIDNYTRQNYISMKREHVHLK